MKLAPRDKVSCPSCNKDLGDLAEHYVIAGEEGDKSFAEDKCYHCGTRFSAIRLEDGNIHFSIISRRLSKPVKEHCKTFIENVSSFHIILMLVLILSLVAQPWERPEKKVADEWKACDYKYNDKCRYIGPKFRSPEWETDMAQLLHGDVDLKELRNLNK